MNPTSTTSNDDDDDYIYGSSEQIEIVFILLFFLSFLISGITYLAIKLNDSISVKVSFRVLRHFFLTAAGFAFVTALHGIINLSMDSQENVNPKTNQIICLIMTAFVRYFRFSNVVWMIFLAYTIKYMYYNSTSPPPRLFTKWILWAYLLPIVQWLIAFFFPYGSSFFGDCTPLYLENNPTSLYQMQLTFYMASFVCPMVIGYCYSFATFALLIKINQKFINFEKAVNGGTSPSSNLGKDQEKFLNVLWELIKFPIVSFVLNLPFQIQISFRYEASSSNSTWAICFAVALFLQALINLYIALKLDPVYNAFAKLGNNRTSIRSTMTSQQRSLNKVQVSSINQKRRQEDNGGERNVISKEYKPRSFLLGSFLTQNNDPMKERLTGGTYDFKKETIEYSLQKKQEMASTKQKSHSSGSSIISSPSSTSYLENSSKVSQYDPFNENQKDNNEQFFNNKNQKVKKQSKAPKVRISFQETPLEIRESLTGGNQSLDGPYSPLRTNTIQNFNKSPELESNTLRHSQISSVSTLTNPSSVLSSISSKTSISSKNNSFFDESSMKSEKNMVDEK